MATVLQEDVDTLFVRAKPDAQVRLIGEAQSALSAGNIRKIPAEKHTLPSPAIGWAGGRDVAISPNDMATGEGKTLTAGLAAVLVGWTKRPCHIIKANDYLVQRCGVAQASLQGGRQLPGEGLLLTRASHFS